MRVGICGGTFDPFHRGHLETVLAARDAMQWDRVVYIPAWRQPFKSDRDPGASGYHRFAMAVLATEARDGMLVSPVELERGGISYSVDTLEHLRAQYADDTLDWIIGDDNLAALDAWRNLPRIFELANFAVLTRHAPAANDGASIHGAPVVAAAQRPTHGAIVFAHNPTVPVSSTEIRNRVRAGEPIDALVDPRVARYIDHNRLYREAHS